MASIFAHPISNVQTLAVIVKRPDGSQRRIVRSLKTNDAALASKIGDAVQKVADRARTSTQRQLLRLVEDVLDTANVPVPWEKINAGAVLFSEFSRQWLERKGRTSKPSTVAAAKGAIDLFLATFDDPALSAITGQMIQDHYDAQIKAGLAMSTTNNRLAILSSIFRYAVGTGVIQINPAASVQAGKSVGVVPREDLPDEDFDRLLKYLDTIAAADAQSWITAAMLGRFCGLRLCDAANLSTTAVTVQDGVTILSFHVQKTDRVETVPVLHPPLCERLAKLPVGVFCCPALVGKPAPRLSRRFSDLLIAAGVVSPVIKTGSGRLYRQYSFHGLRHAMLSDLSKRGVPAHLAMKLSGHKTAKIHAGYVHESALEIASQVSKYFTP